MKNLKVAVLVDGMQLTEKKDTHKRRERGRESKERYRRKGKRRKTN